MYSQFFDHVLQKNQRCEVLLNKYLIFVVHFNNKNISSFFVKNAIAY
jgi:hypothetical protein